VKILGQVESSHLGCLHFASGVVVKDGNDTIANPHPGEALHEARQAPCPAAEVERFVSRW
jgi:hypothetical protein